MRKNMIWGFFIVGFLALLFAGGMSLKAFNTKPFYVKFYAGLVATTAGVLVLYVTLGHDTSSSKKSDDILETTKSTKTGVESLEIKADSSINKMDQLSLENDSLKRQVNYLHEDLTSKNETIMELTQRTADLSIKLSEKAKDIYDLSKKLKYPLPDEVTASYQVIFELEKSLLEKAESIFSANKVFPEENEGAYISFDGALLKDIFQWQFNSNEVMIDFSLTYELSKDSYGPSNSMLWLSNNDFSNRGYANLQSQISFNRKTKDFLLVVDNVRLKRRIKNLSPSVQPNLMAKSIDELENTTMIFLQHFPKTFQSVQIFNLDIESKELNLHFRELKSSKCDFAFISSFKDF